MHTGIAWRYNRFMKIPIRQPIVAGAFYPGTHAGLMDALTGLFGGKRPSVADTPAAPEGLIVPHAGYAYSGRVAADGYREVAQFGKPDRVIILGTNHTGLGRPISIAREGIWRTPLGNARVDSTLADRLIGKGFSVADEAFWREHSIEVQLPFLQYLFGPETSFVPICVMLPSFSELAAAGEGLSECIRGESILLVISSDFTHYEPDDIARRLDREAIDRILEFDAQGFYNLVVAKRLSICGAGAITILLVAARKLGWQGAKLISYATSGDATGDRSAVVGYAAIAVKERARD